MLRPTTMQRSRNWQGPALFSFGFRPFFLFAAIWEVIAISLWIPAWTGELALPSRLDPVSWHAHEFLFGYLGAVLAGFLLTSVPNWTGRLPVVGWRLVGLFSLWVAGRCALLFSAEMPNGVAALVDLAFPLALVVVVLREIVAGRNWRNLLVVALLSTFLLANALFHLDALQGGYAAGGIGVRLGLATGILMISVIGGRIIPSFTRNWLVRQGSAARPAPPMQPVDKLVLVASVVALLLWLVAPAALASGIGLLFMGGLHVIRLVRWQGHRTLSEPLVLVLHTSYAFVPIGALALGVELLLDGSSHVAVQHLWMAGAIGSMTLAVMTRATLGHTGQPLTAGFMTNLIYFAVFGAAAVRFAAGTVPMLVHMAGALWLVAFVGFVLAYGPLLLRPRPGSGA